MELDDLDLRPPADDVPPPPAEPRARALWAAVTALVIAALGAGGYFVFQGRRAPAPGEGQAAVPAAGSAAPAVPLGGPADAVEVPPLDQSDEFVRVLVSALSSDPRFLAWLATDGLIRTFAVVVANVADGETPSRHLPLMRPLSEFRVADRNGALYVDGRSYERYNSLAAAAASIDPAGSARIYTILKPRIDEAYRDLGYPDTPFDQTLERAIVTLLATPVPNAVLQLEPRGGTDYAYADPELEGLNAAQKQLLRCGPRNARLIQVALRNIALALGIPPARLPAVPA